MRIRRDLPESDVGSSTVIRVPRPGALSILKDPLASVDRSSIPSRPQARGLALLPMIPLESRPVVLDGERHARRQPAADRHGRSGGPRAARCWSLPPARPEQAGLRLPASPVVPSRNARTRRAGPSSRRSLSGTSRVWRPGQYLRASAGAAAAKSLEPTGARRR